MTQQRIDHTLGWYTNGLKLNTAAVTEVVERLDDLGLSDLLAAWIPPQRGGKKAAVGPKAIVVALALAGLYLRSVNATDLTTVLYQLITAEGRELLGVKECASGARAYDRVLRAYNRLMRHVDPTNDRTSRPGVRVERAPLDDEVVAEREERTQRLSDLFLDFSVSYCPEALFDRWDGSLAVDATALGQHTRGVRRNGVSEIPSDPEAGWYVRGNDNYAGDDKRHRKAKSFVAYEAEFAAMGNGDPNEPYAHPNLVLGIRLHKPGKDPAAHARIVVERIYDKYGRVGYLAADRAYNNSVPENFQTPLRQRGAKFLFDYREDQLGAIAQAFGARFVEGALYCTSMPEVLIDATKDYRAGNITEEVWQIRIAERENYQLRVKDSSQGRFACPATGPSPSVGCVVRHGGEAKSVGRVLIPVAPAEPLPKVCTNKASVTIDLDSIPVIAKHMQALPYGSPLQQQMYKRLRSTIEGFNGSAKDLGNAGIGGAGRRRRRGRANQTILVSALVAAANIIRIRNWLDEYTEPITTPEETLVRRRRTRQLGIVSRREIDRAKEPPAA